MKNSVVMLIFPVFTWKFPCLRTLFQNIKMFVEAEIWILDQFEYVEFNADFHFFFSRLKIPFLSQLVSKIQNYQFKVACVVNIKLGFID